MVWDGWWASKLGNSSLKVFFSLSPYSLGKSFLTSLGLSLFICTTGIHSILSTKIIEELLWPRDWVSVGDPCPILGKLPSPVGTHICPTVMQTNRVMEVHQGATRGRVMVYVGPMSSEAIDYNKSGNELVIQNFFCKKDSNDGVWETFAYIGMDLTSRIFTTFLVSRNAMPGDGVLSHYYM